MSNSSYDFRIGSLNVRGINRHSKRIAIFNWVKQQNFDLMFLQETYSSTEDENLWQSEWGGKTFWSHGSKHSRGVGILVKKGFDIEALSICLDVDGRYILIKANIQGEPMNVLNLYAPNSEADKSTFFKSVCNILVSNGLDRTDPLIIGGDWNTVLDPSIDKSGGRTLGESISTEMKNLMNEFELIDIWRLKNSNTKRYTYRQKRPLIQTRLDYFLITKLTTDVVESAKILSSFCSDHSCIALDIKSLEVGSRGKGFWK